MEKMVRNSRFIAEPQHSTRGRVYEGCVRSALLYGGELLALTSRLMDVLYADVIAGC